MITKTMFQSIRDALSKDDSGGDKTYKEVLKLEPGKTYTVRILPNSVNPVKTFFHYFQHGWTSFATGQYVSALSLQTFNERDPIAEERFKLLRVGTDDEKAKIESVKRAEKWLVNVYVVEDPTNPENKGKVKILRYGRQIHKIIESAINGEDAEEFGHRVFDLSAEGCSFKIKCETQGDYPTYVSSRFSSPSDLKLSDQKIEEIYKGIHNLESVMTVKTADEIRATFNEHFHLKGLDETSSTSSEAKTDAAPQKQSAAKSVAKSEPVAEDENEITDDIIQDLLRDL